MQSDTIKNKEEKTGFTEISAVASEDKKQRFGLKIFPETMEIIDTLLSMTTASRGLSLLKRQYDFTADIFLTKSIQRRSSLLLSLQRSRREL